MVKVVEESLDVRIHYPAVAAPMESLAEFQCCALWPFASPLAMRTFQKVLLVYRQKDLRSCCLYNLVAYNGYPERTTTSDFGNIVPANQFRLVIPVSQLFHHVADVCFQIVFVGFVVNSIDAGGCFPIKLRKAPAQICLVQKAVKVSESVF